MLSAEDRAVLLRAAETIGTFYGAAAALRDVLASIRHRQGVAAITEPLPVLARGTQLPPSPLRSMRYDDARLDELRACWAARPAMLNRAVAERVSLISPHLGDVDAASVAEAARRAKLPPRDWSSVEAVAPVVETETLEPVVPMQLEAEVVETGLAAELALAPPAPVAPAQVEGRDTPSLRRRVSPCQPVTVEPVVAQHGKFLTAGRRQRFDAARSAELVRLWAVVPLVPLPDMPALINRISPTLPPVDVPRISERAKKLKLSKLRGEARQVPARVPVPPPLGAGAPGGRAVLETVNVDAIVVAEWGARHASAAIRGRTGLGLLDAVNAVRRQWQLPEFRLAGVFSAGEPLPNERVYA